MNVHLRQMIVIQMLHVQILLVVLPAHVIQDLQELEQPIPVLVRLIGSLWICIENFIKSNKLCHYL